MKQIPIFVVPNEKREVTDHIVMARQRTIPGCMAHKAPKSRPVKPVSGNLQYPYTFFEKINQNRPLEGKLKEQPEIAIDGTKHTDRTADKKILHLKLKSTPIEFQRSPKKDISPNKHQLRGSSGKYVSASEKTQKMKEGIISKSKLKVRKVESGKADSDFEFYDRSDGETSTCRRRQRSNRRK